MSLPNSWVVTPLSNLLDQIVGGGTPSKAIAANFIGTVPFMTVKDMKARFISDTADHISEEAVASSATTKIPADTLVVATRMSLGKIVRPSVEVAINQDLKALFPSAGINKTYIEYFWCSKSDFIQSKGTGTTVKGIRIEDIKNLEVPLAPENEQRRIADKLDTTLARVDALNVRLARITPLLKRFRQSVLAAATSGRLMEDYANRSGPYPIFPLSKLADARLGKMLDKEKNTGEPVKYLRNVNVRWFSFVLDDLLEMRAEARDLEELSIENGDVLICEGGEPGRCAVWRMGNANLIFQKALHRVRVDKSKLLPEWLAINLKHQADSGDLEKLFTGSTIKHLTGTSLAKVEIPLPGIDEQTEIVRRVEMLFAFADRLEARLQSAQTAAERLTPALLAKAFRGELVPQDPNDEPATELLRRLREARAAQAPAKRGRGRKAAAAGS